MAREEVKKSENAFRTISEVADDLGVQQHVLRFWETKFSSIKPMKRGGGRRYYRPEDVALLKKIHRLLYSDGYTIKGVQKLLKGVSKNAVLQEQRQAVQQKAQAYGDNMPQLRHTSGKLPAPEQQQSKLEPDNKKAELEALLNDLLDMKKMLSQKDLSSNAA